MQHSFGTLYIINTPRAFNYNIKGNPMTDTHRPTAEFCRFSFREVFIEKIKCMSLKSVCLLAKTLTKSSLLFPGINHTEVCIIL